MTMKLMIAMMKLKMLKKLIFPPLRFFCGDFVDVDVDIDVDEESKEGENVEDERSKSWKYFRLPFFSFSPLFCQKEKKKRKKKEEKKTEEKIEGPKQTHDERNLKKKKEEEKQKGRQKGRQKEISNHIQGQISERWKKDTYDGIEEIEESERMKERKKSQREDQREKNAILLPQTAIDMKDGEYQNERIRIEEMKERKEKTSNSLFVFETIELMSSEEMKYSPHKTTHYSILLSIRRQDEDQSFPTFPPSLTMPEFLHVSTMPQTFSISFPLLSPPFHVDSAGRCFRSLLLLLLRHHHHCCCFRHLSGEKRGRGKGKGKEREREEGRGKKDREGEREEKFR